MSKWVYVIIIIIIILLIVGIVILYFVFRNKSTTNSGVSPIPQLPLKYGDIISINSVNGSGPLIPCGVAFIDTNTCKNNVIVSSNSSGETPSNTVKSWTINSATKKTGDSIFYGDEVIITSATGGNLDICGVTDTTKCGDNIGITTEVGNSALWIIQKTGLTSKPVTINTKLTILNKSANLTLSLCGSTDDCSLCTGATENCSLNATLRPDSALNVWTLSRI